MKNPSDCQTIEDVRQAIDIIDGDIIALLGQRLEYVKQAAKYKTDKDSVVAVTRFNAVIASRREMAQLHKLSPDVIEQMYRILIGYFIDEEAKELLARQ